MAEQMRVERLRNAGLLAIALHNLLDSACRERPEPPSPWPFAAIDKNLAGIEVDIADLDVDELAHAHRRIEEQLEQDLVLHVTAVLDGAEEAFQIGIGKQLRQPALFASRRRPSFLRACCEI